MPGYDAYFFTPADRGYLGESNASGPLASATALPTAGRLELTRLKVPGAGNVTNIVVEVTTAGSSLTAGQCFAALYTAAGTLIAQSVDQTTNWGGTGMKNAQLNGGPYFIPGGEYYVALWFNGTTGPTLLRVAGSSGFTPNHGRSAPNLIAAWSDAGTTIAAPATLGTQTNVGNTWWVALA
jgi:hypothetical protein